MKIETLKKSHLKRNIIIGIITVLLISAVILNFTRAKYRVTQSIPLVNGTINYSLADFNAVAIYINGDSGYTKTDTIPDGYVLNESESYCTVNGEKDTSISVSYNVDTKSLSITPMTKKGTKCYLYFEEKIGKTMQEIILANYNIGTRTDFNTPVTEETTKQVYSAFDWTNNGTGISYYFVGNPTDNWVRFGEFYWRIVRINGNGSIRLIYSGNSTSGPATTVSDTRIGISAFNTSYNASYYVGLKYTENEQHGQNTESTILQELNRWYSNSGLEAIEYSSHIDSSIGFCSDRNTASGSSWVSSGDTVYYAAYERLVTNKNPSLKCSNNDILSIPVGLITADEIAFAGGVHGLDNNSYYLSNGPYYTMTPYMYVNAGASVFSIFDTGRLASHTGSYIYGLTGVRPVINLKDDTRFSLGDGTVSNPFVVS